MYASVFMTHVKDVKLNFCIHLDTLMCFGCAMAG